MLCHEVTLGWGIKLTKPSFLKEFHKYQGLLILIKQNKKVLVCSSKFSLHSGLFYHLAVQTASVQWHYLEEKKTQYTMPLHSQDWWNPGGQIPTDHKVMAYPNNMQSVYKMRKTLSQSLWWSFFKYRDYLS